MSIAKRTVITPPAGSSEGRLIPTAAEEEQMSEPVAAHASVYALLADGRTVEIRPASRGGLRRRQGHARGDVAEQRLPALLQPQQARGRAGGAAGHQGARTRPRRPARRLRRPGGRARQLRGGHGRCRPASGRTAEVAFAVADTMHHRGIATLLLEHLVSLARARQLEALIAETLQENTGMLRVFSDAGLPVREQARGRRGRHHDPAAARRHRHAARRTTWTRSPSASGPPTWPASGRCSRRSRSR